MSGNYELRWDDIAWYENPACCIVTVWKAKDTKAPGELMALAHRCLVVSNVSKGRIVGVWERTWVWTAIFEKGLAGAHTFTMQRWHHPFDKIPGTHCTLILWKKSYQNHEKRRTLKWGILCMWSMTWWDKCHKNPSGSYFTSKKKEEIIFA